MMVITSKLYLTRIHEESLKNTDEVCPINIKIQKRVIEELSDWDRDDCMISGYEYSAFSPYEHFVSREEILEKISDCKNCGDAYLKENMIYNNGYFYCEQCY